MAYPPLIPSHQQYPPPYHFQQPHPRHIQVHPQPLPHAHTAPLTTWSYSSPSDGLTSVSLSPPALFAPPFALPPPTNQGISPRTFPHCFDRHQPFSGGADPLPSYTPYPLPPSLSPPSSFSQPFIVDAQPSPTWESEEGGTSEGWGVYGWQPHPAEEARLAPPPSSLPQLHLLPNGGEGYIGLTDEAQSPYGLSGGRPVPSISLGDIYHRNYPLPSAPAPPGDTSLPQFPPPANLPRRSQSHDDYSILTPPPIFPSCESVSPTGSCFTGPAHPPPPSTPSSLILTLPHHPINPPHLPPVGHRLPLPPAQTITFDGSREFLAGKTPPPGRSTPPPPPPKIDGWIPPDQRPLPPCTSEVVVEARDGVEGDGGATGQSGSGEAGSTGGEGEVEGGRAGVAGVVAWTAGSGRMGSAPWLSINSSAEGVSAGEDQSSSAFAVLESFDFIASTTTDPFHTGIPQPPLPPLPPAQSSPSSPRSSIPPQQLAYHQGTGYLPHAARQPHYGTVLDQCHASPHVSGSSGQRQATPLTTTRPMGMVPLNIAGRRPLVDAGAVRGRRLEPAGGWAGVRAIAGPAKNEARERSGDLEGKGKKRVSGETSGRKDGRKKTRVSELKDLEAMKARVPCPECDETFSRQNDLVRHQKCKHSIEKPFSCPACHKSFGRKDKMDLHIEKEPRCRLSAPPRDQRVRKRPPTTKGDSVLVTQRIE
ncbi:hypothetical protein IAT38_006591 [Cryptococcus sp. DSM 104549]